ncbi:hypothetical protein BDF19DRAFT_235367 [Syncephalis fuscata]|nr:hypothetical protein BDF19DRAFT_235367 [Syncephalis fuscata]
MMMRMVAFLIDGLVLISVIIRRACVLARFHAQCMSFILGSLVLAVIISAFGSFAFRFKLLLFYRTLTFALPPWAISYSWALKGIAIMSIGLFSAFGIWCFHMVRHLVVRPRGKHRPYTEVSLLCGFGALSALLALLHDIIVDSPELRAKESLSLLACILLYLAHTLRCWALLLLSVWQPGTGTHRIRGRLPLPKSKASYWQRVSNRQLRAMEEEERQKQLERGLEAQDTPGSRQATALNNTVSNDRSRAENGSNIKKGLGIAAVLALFARPFRRNNKPQPRPLTINTQASPLPMSNNTPVSPFTPPAPPLPFPPRQRRPSYWSPQELHPPPMVRPMPPPMETNSALDRTAENTQATNSQSPQAPLSQPSLATGAPLNNNTRSTLQTQETNPFIAANDTATN